MKKYLRNPYILAALAVALIGGTALALTRPSNPPSYIDTPKQVSTDEVKKTETAAPTDTQTQNQSDQNLPVISKPILSKSSGNAAPVPAKASIQFACSGMPNASCVLTLTNQSDPNNNLIFEVKTIKEGDLGKRSVTWIWEAKPGIWILKATLSASGYQPNSSDVQTLTVNP